MPRTASAMMRSLESNATRSGVARSSARIDAGELVREDSVVGSVGGVRDETLRAPADPLREHGAADRPLPARWAVVESVGQ